MSDQSYTILKMSFPCPWCDKAEELLRHAGVKYIVTVMSEEMQVYIQNLSGLKTVPVIVKGHTILGGYTDLLKHLNQEGLLDQ